MILKTGYELSHSSTSGATSNDSTGHLIWASVARQLTPLRSVGISTSYSFQTRYNARIWNVSFFTAYELSGRLSLSGSIGVGFLDSDSGGNFTTYTSHTDASYRFAKAVISVAILQDYNQTSLQGGQDFGVTVTRSYTGTLGYALTPFIDTSLRASYSENQFTGVGNSAASPDSTTFSGGAGVTWRIRQWLTVGLDYAYNRYNSSGSSSGVATENRAALRITGSF